MVPSSPPHGRALGRTVLVVGLSSVLSGCGLIKGIAINNVASMLSESGTSVTSDNDPDLIEAAIPTTLKVYEGLLESIPKNTDLLMATCRLSTQYAYAFLQDKADRLGEQDHHDEVVELRDRALKMYLRGKGYCVRGLEETLHGITAQLAKDPDAAVKRLKDKKNVELVYWTAAAWGGAISLGRDKPDIIVDFPAMRALAERTLVLDDTWNKGAPHELMITLDSLPAALGGDPAKAREEFKRAVALQHNLSPGPYVALALGVSQPAQDKKEFVDLLNQALAIDPAKDPDNQLVTLVEQRLARALLTQLDTRFVGLVDSAGLGGPWPVREALTFWRH
jgi:tetratricopeptide (TPR) repeat protein